MGRERGRGLRPGGSLGSNKVAQLKTNQQNSNANHFHIFLSLLLVLLSHAATGSTCTTIDAHLYSSNNRYNLLPNSAKQNISNYPHTVTIYFPQNQHIPQYTYQIISHTLIFPTKLPIIHRMYTIIYAYGHLVNFHSALLVC